MIRLTGLWKNNKQDGTQYLAGNINQNMRIVIFQNDRKKKDSEPDYTVYLAENKKQK